MRIGTWNCRLNIDSKRSALDSLALDLAVVPESAQHPTLASEPGVTHQWTGRNPNKGLGVFAFAPWTITPIYEPDPYPWCLPVSAQHPNGTCMTVLAVWTVKNTGDQRPSYAGQLEAVIERWRDTIEHQPAIIAGDLNASFQGPSLEPHRRNIDTLEAMGTRSAFQLANGPVGPDDEPATLRWIGPGKKPYLYHCDYIFVSALLAGSVMTAQVGSLTDWVETKLSDHCPVLVELDDAQLVAPANDLIQERKRRESQHHETTHAPKSP